MKYQKAVIDVLSSIDDKIELNCRINDNLEQQAQALFKAWFVDFEPFKDGEFVDSELGNTPKELPIEYIGDIVLPIIKTILSNSLENAKLANLRDTLLPKLMSGELKISKIEIEK